MSGGECLSLGHIDSIIQYDYPTEPPSTRQSRVITAIESLLTEGLVVIGEIVGGTEASVDDDEIRWSWTTWFALTPSGERLAEGM